MEKITVVVPVYNTEKYLPECIESIIGQTYKELRILLINDGSTDGSLDICRRYAEKDSRIEVIDKENSGVSDTRNLGIDMADTGYIAFIDSDDLIEPRYFDVLYSSIKKHGADVSVVSYSRSYDDGRQEIFRLCETEKLISNTEALDQACSDTCPWVGFVWGKLYKRSVLVENGLSFDKKIKICEDSIFNYRYMDHVKCVCLNPDILYKYRIQNGSATRRLSSDAAAVYGKISALMQGAQLADKYSSGKFYYNVNKALLTTEMKYISMALNNNKLSEDDRNVINDIKATYKKISGKLPLSVRARYILLSLRAAFKK